MSSPISSSGDGVGDESENIDIVSSNQEREIREFFDYDEDEYLAATNKNRHSRRKVKRVDYTEKEWIPKSKSTAGSKGNNYINRRWKEDRFECEVEGCFWTFRTELELRKHIDGHSCFKPFRCHCGVGFRQSSKLILHVKVHSDRTNVCPYCDRKFVNREKSYFKHLKTHPEF